MNAILRFDGGELWHLAGWTMLHFLWLGTAIGAGAMALRLSVHRAPANVRYVVAIASLLALAASPIGIAVWLLAGKPSHTQRPASMSSTSGGAALDPSTRGYAARVIPVVPDLPAAETGPVNLPTTSSPGPSPGLSGFVTRIGLDGLSADLEPCAQYLPWLWLVGTPFTFVLMTTGIVGAERLRRASRLLDDGPITDACLRVKQTMQITRKVTIAVCERIAAPVLVGIVRPLILLPPAALTGWSPEEIEMVLLHELAHVRRWDNLVNLVQRIVESLLFFHPAVWLLSRWVRREREACCDAVVVGRTAQPHAYAELLVALAAQMPRSVLFHPANVSLLPAASSAMAAGPLRGRIRRILQLEDDPMLVTRKSLLVVLGGLLVVAAFGVLNVPSPIRAEQQSGGNSVNPGAMATDNVGDALETLRKTLVTYDLNFDSVFPKNDLLSPDLKRLERYPTADAWPSILGHADTDASKYRVVKDKPAAAYEKATGPNAYSTPISWSIGTENYATLLCMKGIEPGANVMVHSYGTVACFGPMAGYLLFDSYANALVEGDLSGQVIAKSYFDMVVTGKFTGHITMESYAMIYLMGGLAGGLELNNSKVYIAGRTTEAELKRISGIGQVYLEDSDLPAGKHMIGNISINVGKPTLVSSTRIEIKSPEGKATAAEFSDGKLKLKTGGSEIEQAGADASSKEGDTQADQSDHATFVQFEDALRRKKPLVIALFNDSGQFQKELQSIYTDYSPRHQELHCFGMGIGAGSDDAKRYRVTAQPTCIVFRSGQETARLADINDIVRLREFVIGQLRQRDLTQAGSAESAAAEALGGGESTVKPTSNFPSLEDQKLGKSFQSLDDPKFAEVPFVLGATRFSDGDTITIRDVRGTAATFEPGNMYWIKGTYTLGSHDRAALSAFTTAKDSANGTSATWKIQTTVVARGNGTFTLCLPMSCPGWPHLSFYPEGGGESFGGVYFGTGDSVLKKWWGPHEVVDSTAAESADKQPSDEDTQKVTIKIDDNQTATAESQPGRLRLQVRRTESKSGKFPSLEDQKLADLAWKRLGIELGPLDEEELKRVKALGYDGGLAVNFGQRTQDPYSIHGGDILVGLHVWPTTSLQDVAELLNRGDIAGLSPFKFYVVRSEGVSQTGTALDSVVTGRITVNLDAPGKTPMQAHDSQSTSATFGITSKAPTPPIAEKASRLDAPDADKAKASSRASIEADVDKKLSADPNLATLNQQLLQVQYSLSEQGKVSTNSPERRRRLEKQLAEIQKQISDYRKLKAEALTNDPYSPYRSASAASPSPNAAVDQPATLQPTVAPAARQMSESTDSSPDNLGRGAPDAAPRLVMHYDGKTFNEWRDVWRSELSTDKRIDAVKALAAFGANGYGKEAADTILEVVQQLDWTDIDNSSAGKLKIACVDAFTNGNSVGGYHIDFNDWLPLVVERLHADQKPTNAFAAYLFDQFYGAHNVEKLLELTHDAKMRSLALLSLRKDPMLQDERVVTRIRQMLGEAETPSEVLKQLLPMLVVPAQSSHNLGNQGQLRFVPEFEPLLFHADSEVRRAARADLVHIQPSDAPQLVERLLAVIGDDARRADRIEAIRALAAMGPEARTAQSAMEEIIKTQPRDEQIASALCLKRILGDTNYQGAVAACLGGMFKSAGGGRGEPTIAFADNANKKVFDEICGSLDAEDGRVFPSN
jgi:beta-lactamase regulating signal transducer with metallopeptidase domain